MKTGLITSDTYQNHNTGDGHPEKIDRVTAVIDNFKKIDNKELVWKKPTKFDQSFLINTHSTEYINLVNKSFPENGLAFLDGDTVVSPGSKEATKDAVGSIIAAIDGVQKREGTMLFFDTNNFKLWDKALLRHSRIDYIVEFKKCSQHIIKDIPLFYFKISEDNKALYDFSKIKDNVWSYSDLDSVVFRHHLNIQECINILSDSENTL